MATATTQIQLFTAHHCPFAHRVQIALRELGLTFETILIDITIPRTPEYLAINKTGMVPALIYDGLVLTESGLICQFLADMHPGHQLLKASNREGGALQRFRIAHFVEFFSKVHANFDALVYSHSSHTEKDGMVEKYIEMVVDNIEPLLDGSAPFFGGSTRITLAEVLTGPFVLRVLNYPKHTDLVPELVSTRLRERAPIFWSWAHTVAAEESVTAIWDEALVVQRTLQRKARQ